MTAMTSLGLSVHPVMLENYFHSLVNYFFKILPIRESGENSLGTYMQSLQAELIGCNNFIDLIHDDPLLISLVSILQFLIDHPSCDVSVVRREVFRAISICNKLQKRYSADKS